MDLPEFDYFEPATLGEACALLAEDPEGGAVLAGGTDILVNLKEGLASYRRLVSLRLVDGLDAIEFSREAGLWIGAMATVNQVARHEAVRQHYPGIVEAALSLAAEQVRNLATVGGNLCSAVPSADMAPILLAHGARVRAVAPGGERIIPLAEFFTGPRTTVLGRSEVVAMIEVPPPTSGRGDASVRQGGRDSLSLPHAAAAAVVTADAGGCRAATVALGAVAPTPMIAASVGEFLAGKRLTDEVLAQAGELAAIEAKPITDLRAGKEYRLELVKVLTRRALATAAGRAGRG
jgi:carbon-monoxide dehydrogenase medium subunit